MEREGEDRVTVSFDGTRIGWTLYDHGEAPAILIVPGFWRTRSHESIVSYARALWKRGFTVATMDLRGHGESEGVFGFNLSEHLDVEAVVREIRKATGCPHLILVGFSYGGAVAISAAAATSAEPEGLFLVSPVAELALIRPRLNPLTIHRHIAPGQVFHKPSFESGILTSPKRSAIDDIRKLKVPIHFIHVRNDWLVGHQHSEQLALAHPGPHVVEILDVPGNYHADRIFHAAPGRVEESSFRFLDEILEGTFE